MADSAEPLTRRYSAFISYSHADAKAVHKLHRQLETYRLPRRLATNGADGARRLRPVFRDDDEMGAAHDLTEAIHHALAQADYLIVICSPHAAKSAWVGREIELFRALHGDRRILAALLAGDAESSFPAALRNGSHQSSIEPFAADFRPGASGGRLALLRLVAPMAGVRLDELVQRDAQRQVRRIAVAGAGAVAGIAVVATLAVYGVIARHDAEAQSARAGGLNAFMLTDLRKGLQSAGRLDLLTAVNKAALDSYRGQDLAHLPADTLEQRAKALQAAGEDNEKRGDPKTAQAQFEEARRTTAALLAAKPNDPQRIFDQAQSEYWVGFINWRNGDGAAAKTGFDAYAALTGRLVRIDPNKAEWQSEVGSAESNLGMLALRLSGDAAQAQAHFSAALLRYQSVAASKPGDVDAALDLADGYSWLADSERIQGKFDRALASRETQRRILQSLADRGVRHAEIQANLAYGDLARARIYAERGAWAAALEALDHGHADAVALQRSDPQNGQIAKQVRVFDFFKVRTVLSMPLHRRPNGYDPAAQLVRARSQARNSATMSSTIFATCCWRGPSRSGVTPQAPGNFFPR